MSFSSSVPPSSVAAAVEDRIENEYADETFAESHDATTADVEEYLSDYEPETDFVEEEVESLPEHERLNPGGLTIIGHSALLHSAPTTNSESHTPATSDSSSTTTKPAPAPQTKKSSLPSLTGGLPSIGAMSSSLTAAGRAHFAQSSLFGKSSNDTPSAASAIPKAVDSQKPNPLTTASLPVSSTAASTSSPPTSNAHISASYATANEIWSVENLGLHVVSVTDTDSSDASARETIVTLIDEGRLSLWAGKVGSDSMALPSVNGGAASTTAFGNSLFLRAATISSHSPTNPSTKGTPSNLIPDISKLNDTEYLHIWIDEADGSLNPSSDIVDDEGRAVAELPSSFQPKRLGCYRFRLISRSTSLPAQPDNLQQFMSKAQQMGINTQPGMHGTESSPFEIAPIITLYVAVEKFLPLDSSPAKVVDERCNKSLVLPPLPLDSMHTFWISTNQPSKTCSLYFAENGAEGSNSDSFELNLDIVPLHESILRELDLKSVQVDGDDDENDDEDEEGNGGKPVSDRKRKKNAKKKAKKKKDKQQKAANASADPSSPSLPALVAVQIALTPDASTSDLVHLTFQPSTSADASPAFPTPSLVDLLATLAASPSTSLPDSILQANQSMSQLGELTYQLMNQNGATASATSQPSSSSSTSAPSTTPAASSIAVNLSALDRKQHWPFTVSLSAMRLSESSEGHKSFDQLDLLHNVPLPSRVKSSTAANNGDWKQRRVVYVGDHAVTILRTVGLLCAWESPKDGSQLNEPVLVSQQPFLSYHMQLSIRRLDPEEAEEREFEAMLG